MTYDPSAGQPRNRGRYAHRTNSPSPIALGGNEPFPPGARVVGNGTFGFVKEGERPGGYIPVDDGGHMTVYIKPRYLMNVDAEMDAIIPPLERSYAPGDAFNSDGTRKTMDVFLERAAGRPDRSGHTAYTEALCALAGQDTTPQDFEEEAAALTGSDTLPDAPDFCTPLRASRLARHFAAKASGCARDRDVLNAAMYADVAVIFAGGHEAAGPKDRSAMVTALQEADGDPHEFLDRAFAGEFDFAAPTPHTVKV